MPRGGTVVRAVGFDSCPGNREDHSAVGGWGLEQCLGGWRVGRGLSLALMGQEASMGSWTHSPPGSTGPEVQKQRCGLGVGTQVQPPAALPLALRDGFGLKGSWAGSHRDGLGTGESREGPGPLPSPCAHSIVSLRAD